MGHLDAEVLVYGCRGNDLRLLARALGSSGMKLRAADSGTEFVRHAVSGRPSAVVLGVGTASIADLRMISLIQAINSDLPAIIVAEDESLELERSARQANIFYYLVHPIDDSELHAVLEDLMRHSRG